MLTFLIALSVLFALLALHPFVTYPLSLKFIRRCFSVTPSVVPPFAHLPPEDQKSIRFTVCMCVYNEEKVIDLKMRNLMMLREHEPELEILVYVDGATDSTAAILGDYADRINLQVSHERLGKTHGMNLLVAQASAPVIVFTDANVLFKFDALQKLRRYFNKPEIGCVCGNLIYTNEKESVTAASGSLYWRLEQTIKRLEEETGSVMGADGSLYAIRRELHHAPPDYLIDDMYVSLMILCAGYRVVQATDVTAYESSVSSGQEEFRRKVRIACQAFNVHRHLWLRIQKLDTLTVYKYVSHKVIRWFTIYSLALSLIFLLAALVAAGKSMIAILLTISTLAGLLLGYLWAIKPFNQILDLLAALSGAGIGVWQSIRGERYQTWTPAASIRKT
ncbi:MAG TPA: glycosyltransferase [Burkholderiales bacterium]|nr:glycosyltransferase [Burkholderiales bacterium]